MNPVHDAPAALENAVREVESHASRSGWDQPAQLFALVETADLLEREPHLAELLGVAAESQALTPVEQETTSESLDELLASIVWPPEVAGCAVVLEAMTVPPDADQVPTDPEAAAEYAAAHPDREEARIVAGALRSGESFCTIRQRAHDEDDMVLAGPDLVPALLELLHTTLKPEPGDPPDDE
ncbi:MAG: hypothetical protein JWR85_371 [Marmoricola sp.]|nr:hypothetical protein [Marmoricola sp.]